MTTPTTRALRSDALPEGWIRTGTRAPCGHLAPCGCRHWGGCCEACPLPRCVKDGTTSSESRSISQIPRNNAIVAARDAGASINDISDRFRLNERWILHILAVARSAAAPPGERVRVA